MLLVLTTADDATADYLCRRLHDERVQFVRLDTDHFADSGFVEYIDNEISLIFREERLNGRAIRNVWYRRPRGIVVRGRSTDAQRLHTAREWATSLDGFLAEIPQMRWMNHPACNARANNKLFQLRLAPRFGLRVPETIVTRSLEEAQRFWRSHHGKIVTKPLSVGYVETLDGVMEAQILTSEVRAEHLRDPEILARCPTILQQRVQRGVDVRVTVVDRKVCALAVSSPGRETPVDIRQDGMSDLVYEPVSLPATVCANLLNLCHHLELRFAAVDFIRSCDDEWYFLEVNPNGQWAWLDLVGASDIARWLVDAFRS